MTSIIFLGTPKFAVPILKALANEKYEIKAVVTQPDKKVGRKQEVTESPVKVLAQKLNLPVFQPAHLAKSEEVAALIAMHADLIITAAYGQFLPSKFLQSAKIAAVNVHGSMLPKYRGGAPIQYALINGDKQTGVTIMEMVKQMDAGAIYAQKAIDIQKDDTAGTVFEKLSFLGRDLLLQTLPQIIADPQKKTAQDETKVVFSPNISKEQEQIKISMTATEANNLIRGLNPDPGAYLLVDNKRFKVWRAEVTPETTSLSAGTVVDNKKRFAISFANHTVLNLLEVQPAGKKKMTVKSFLNGQGKSFAIGDKIVGS
ncbi:methionyl-tRNA formyltransferase [Lactobacillus sp. ESL0260]|uniref:methionyl-tRNA formyltransferase n=1 Tax=Lactobacillus sp. ESL0260 TaxID=2069347 RepID=UPI000EFD0F5C|nr:methionyl-tRNA formyltransferase [Lactobacillus sp. ESL0260]RMC57206.1 methionyl-tRNA formyltransferase [Lactobacillus sp. ESL0260]